MFNQSRLLNGNCLHVPFLAHLHYIGRTTEELIKAVDKARSKKVPILVLGSTSNVILTSDWHGVCIQPKVKGVEVLQEDENEVMVSVGSGESLSDFINYASLNGWHGMENLIGIPGWVGAAVVQNVGAYNACIRNCLHSVEVIDTLSSEVRRKYTSELKLSYRDSLFKRRPDRWIITHVILKLSKKFNPNIEYHRVKSDLMRKNIAGSPSQISPELMMETILYLRSKTIETREPNVGSVFLNPLVSWRQLEEILSLKPNTKYFKLSKDFIQNQYNDEEYVMISAGSMIENIGFKNYSLGCASVSSKSAVILTKKSKEPAADFVALINLIQEEIRKQYHVELKVEPRII